MIEKHFCMIDYSVFNHNFYVFMIDFTIGDLTNYVFTHNFLVFTHTNSVVMIDHGIGYLTNCVFTHTNCEVMSEKQLVMSYFWLRKSDLAKGLISNCMING